MSMPPGALTWKGPSIVSSSQYLRVLLAAEACRVDLAQVVRDAAEDGVQDLEAACEALVVYERAPRLQLELEARYVHGLLQLRSQEAISRDKAALTLLLPGNVGIHLHEKGSDAASRTRLLKQVEDCAEKLGIGMDDHWTADSPDAAVRQKYIAALEEVRSGVMDHYQRLVEDQAFKLKVVQQNRRTESGKNAIKLDKSMKATRKYVAAVLAMSSCMPCLQHGITDGCYRFAGT